MLRCLNGSENLAGSFSEMTVLERQRERMKWQQQQQQQQFQHHHHQNLNLNQNQNQNQSYNFCGNGFDGAFSSALQIPNSQGLMMMTMMMNGGGAGIGDVVANARSVKPDPGSETGWPELGKLEIPNLGFASSGFDNNGANSVVSRTSSSCPSSAAVMATATPVAGDGKGKETFSSATEKMRSASMKKRKPDKIQNPKVCVAENESNNSNKKKNKGSVEEDESKITTNEKNREGSGEEDSCCKEKKENSKASELVQKPDYIHVRARRGQATDSHSLAERVRREKISERMKYLQDLVPGCNKITGKAGMLDEIINYVQSLQRQVEFLSMKLATVNPRIDFNVDDLFTKEVFPACAPHLTGFPAIEMAQNPGFLQFDSAQHALDMGLNPTDLGLRRTISAPVSMPPETFHDFSQQILPFSSCEADLQSLYNVGFDQSRSTTTSYPSQPFTGLIEGSNLKMEM